MYTETQRHTNTQRDTKRITARPLSRSKRLSVSLASSQMLANYNELMGIIVPLSNCWNILEGQKNTSLSLTHPQRRDYSPKLEWGVGDRCHKWGSTVSPANYPCWKEQASFPGLTSRGIICGDLIPDFMKRNITIIILPTPPHPSAAPLLPPFFAALFSMALILTANSGVFILEPWA